MDDIERVAGWYPTTKGIRSPEIHPIASSRFLVSTTSESTGR